MSKTIGLCGTDAVKFDPSGKEPAEIFEHAAEDGFIQ